MFIRTIGLGLLLAVTASQAIAGEPAKHTMEWYRAHQQDRANVLRTCQNDHTYDDSADCRNAASADHAALADSLGTAGVKDPESNPAYYGRNGPLIAMTLSMCARNAAPQSWCVAARSASANLPR